MVPSTSSLVLTLLTPLSTSTHLGDAGEPVAKQNYFGWYILGQVDSGSNSMSEIRSVDVATLSAEMVMVMEMVMKKP